MRRHISRRLCLAFVAIAIVASVSLAEELPLRDLVITGSPQPVRIALQVTANGQPWQQHFDEVQRRYLRAVFSQIDKDRDGKISAGEAKRLPKPRVMAAKSAASDVHIAFNYRVIDADDDGDVSMPEYERYALSFGELPVWMTTVTTARPDGDLFRALDADRDRVVTAAEWSAAEKLLANDRDGNRVLTPEELRPPMAATGPPEFVAGARPPRKPLSMELKAPASEPADVVVAIDFPIDPAAAPRVDVILSERAATVGIKVERGKDREPVLNIDGRRLVLRFQLPALRAETAVRLELLQDFSAAKEKTGGPISVGAEMSPRLKQIFPLADRNDDGQLEQGEFDAYLETIVPLEAATDAARLRLVGFSERPGLLPLVDLNLDGRLSLREISWIPARLNAIGGESGKLVREELPSTMVLVLQRAPSGESTELDVLQNAGPPWFFRADRNHDGDLDREEFFGSTEDFSRLDVNKDGWIELDEAVRGDFSAKPEGSK